MDITERKRVERELAESEARFSALADGLPMPVWVLDAQGVVRFVNSAYGEFFGVDISSGTVSAWSELLHRKTCRCSSLNWRPRWKNSVACTRWCVRAGTTASGVGSR